jgi:hypothetical protein
MRASRDAACRHPLSGMAKSEFSRVRHRHNFIIA